MKSTQFDVWCKQIIVYKVLGTLNDDKRLNSLTESLKASESANVYSRRSGDYSITSVVK